MICATLWGKGTARLQALHNTRIVHVGCRSNRPESLRDRKPRSGPAIQDE